jgi:hypothetical protein
LSFRWAMVFVTALGAAACTVTTARADAPCGSRGFAYAGIQSDTNGHGISAVLTALTTPAVESGHVAGWVGVGGPGEGPGGTNTWIQVGLNRMPDTGNTLYYELMRPGSGVSYEKVTTDVPTGQQFRVAVLETASTPGAWRVWVNGRPVTPPLWLGRGDRLTPMAMGESWDGGRAACNRFSYRFARVSIAAARGGSWQPTREATLLQDPGYRVVTRATATFDAAAVGLLPRDEARGSVPRILASTSSAAPAVPRSGGRRP